nr:RNA-dependent RNA polymerase 6 [Tanacetum cinerariifolium]
MDSDRNDKKMIVTQVSVGGIDNEVTAKMLLDYLEATTGLVWRCRLKKSSTPPDTYPEFDADLDKIQQVNDYEKVEPHAFVHYVDPDSVITALEAARRGELVLNNKALKVNVGPENPYRMNQLRRKETPFRLSNVGLEVGLLSNRDNFLVGWRGADSGVDFLIDPFDRSCKFLFTKETAFSFKGTRNYAVIKCNYKVEFLVRDVNVIKEYDNHLVLVFQLVNPPVIFYRTADDDIHITHPSEMLDDDDPWIRTTDFTPSGAIGRCNTYRVSIRIRDVPKAKKALAFLKEQRVNIEHPTTKLRVEEEPGFGILMQDPLFSIHYEQDLSFKTLFLVNSVVHRCIINQHQFTEKVFDLLRSQPEEVNVAALKDICSYRKPLYDGLTCLEKVQKRLSNNPKLIEKPLDQNDSIEVRRLVITPSKAYCLPPEVELSNRVLRHYREVSDRFLRVTFMDEGMKTLNNQVLNFYPAPIVKDITSSLIAQKTTMFRRVKNILSQGFYVSGRKYSFLAFSANQLRDRSAWFFADDGKITCKQILSWMGKFSNRNIAKCAARMGQCFSSTYATVEVPRHEVDLELEDIKRNNYTFSDGIGKMSPELALEVAEKLQLTDNQPCAYQIRYAGCKGVVVWWPDKKGDSIKLSLRPSMNKFESEHTILEICSWTRVQPGFLNRQIITLLSALDVEDDIFWDMQMKMVMNLNQMLVDTDVAFDVITSSCAESGNTASIMLAAGFKPQTEPHLRGMLSSIRVAQLGDLREKSRIFVQDGRWLMGCLDELAVLEQGQCFIQVSNPSVENCFAKHGSRFVETKRNLTVIEGYVVIAKNPCLHPGDVRVLKAVNVPGLEHLVDCLIFPQKGDRPHTDEASGSDLDGDLYFVTWDEHLIPPSKRSWPPMEYTAAEAKELPRDVRHTDIIDFFTKNMVNDSLGTICNAHVVHSDISEYGALDEKCTKLAELAATAVDFPKTGKIDAWGCKMSYDRQLNGILGQYKVTHEEEIVTGHIWSMPKHGSKKQADYLARIKIRCTGAGYGKSQKPIDSLGRYLADRM